MGGLFSGLFGANDSAKRAEEERNRLVREEEEARKRGAIEEANRIMAEAVAAQKWAQAELDKMNDEASKAIVAFEKAVMERAAEIETKRDVVRKLIADNDTEGKINVAVAGSTGAGKSSFINAIMQGKGQTADIGTTVIKRFDRDVTKQEVIPRDRSIFLSFCYSPSWPWALYKPSVGLSFFARRPRKARPRRPPTAQVGPSTT